MKTRMEKAASVATLGLFTALTVVLQMMSYIIKIGTFNLSLVLVPIVIVAVLYGPKYGAVIGFAFGATVVVATVTGLDGGAFIMFNTSPVITVVLCLLKGTLCGAAAGAVARLCGRKRTLGAVLAAVTAPVVNTGVFLLAMAAFYRPLLYDWAGQTDVITYMLVGLVGVNFLIELAINMVLTPSVLRIIRAIGRE